MLQADDARRAINGRGRADVVVVVLDDLGLLSEDEAEGAPDVADVQRLVIGIEQQYRAIHDSLRPAGTRPVHVCIVAKVSVDTGLTISGEETDARCVATNRHDGGARPNRAL